MIPIEALFTGTLIEQQVGYLMLKGLGIRHLPTWAQRYLWFERNTEEFFLPRPEGDYVHIEDGVTPPEKPYWTLAHPQRHQIPPAWEEVFADYEIIQEVPQWAAEPKTKVYTRSQRAEEETESHVIRVDVDWEWKAGLCTHVARYINGNLLVWTGISSSSAHMYLEGVKLVENYVEIRAQTREGLEQYQQDFAALADLMGGQLARPAGSIRTWL